MPDALAQSVARPRPQDHRDGAGDIGQRHDESGFKIAEPHRLDDLRQPQAQPVKRNDDADISDGENPHPAVAQPRPQACGRGRLPGKRGGDELLFRVSEEFRARRFVGQHEQHRERQHAGRQTFQQEQPLPAMQALKTIEPQNISRKRGPQRARQWDRCEEQRIVFRALRLREPVGEIKHHARKEPGLRNAEQEAQAIKAPRPLRERHRHGDKSPGEHDAEHPQPRADLFQNHVRRHFEEKISEKENSGADAKRFRAKPQIVIHRERRKADIHPIEKIHHIKQAHERNDPPGDSREDIFHRARLTCRGEHDAFVNDAELRSHFSSDG